MLLIWLLWPESSAPPALFSRILDPLAILAQSRVAPKVSSFLLRYDFSIDFSSCGSRDS